MARFAKAEKVELSSGVTVQVAPFPAGLYNRLQTKSLEDFPDPEPPKKTIEVVDGTEEMDDLSDPAYLAAVEEARRNRLARFAEAIVEICVDLDLDQWQDDIKGIEKFTGKAPEGRGDLVAWFLENYGCRVSEDYAAITESAMRQTLISSKEVQQRVKFFRDDVEGNSPHELAHDASSADEEK